MKDDWWTLLAIAFVVGGGWVLAANYSKPEKTEAPAEPAFRPIGIRTIANLDSGAVWTFDTANVQGPRTARLVWTDTDYSKDKSETARSNRTLYRIDCTTTAYVMLSQIRYSAKGDALSSWHAKPEEEERMFAAPDSNIGNLVEMACQPGFDRPK